MNRDLVPVLFGTLVSTVIAGTLVIAGLKAGITPGVSPLVILVAWGAFQKTVHSSQGTRFLNLAQVAGSAGMAVTAGVIFTAPLVQILYSTKELPVPSVDVVSLIILSFAGALVGWGFVGLTTRKFLSDPTLPAPEARACEVMIQAAVSDQAARPALGRSLYAGIVAGFLAPLVNYLGLVAAKLTLFSRAATDGSRSADAALPFAPIYIGIGGLVTLSTALLVFAGSFIRLIGDLLLTGIDSGSTVAATFPDNSMRWVGGGAMTVAVGYSLIRFLNVRAPKASADDGDSDLLAVDPGKRRQQLIAITLGILVVLSWLFFQGADVGFSIAMSGTILVLATVMVALGAILSLQIGSSASPVSGTIFVSTLVLCLVALATGHRRIEDVLLITPLLVGACVAVCTANDSSQDYKTLQLCGMKVQDGFLAQILGLLGGVIVVPIVLYVAHEAYTLGSPELAAPQGVMFATLIDGLLLQRQLPWYPILIGVGVGLAAVILDDVSGKRGHQIPSMALAVGIYLPAAIGIGILIGALFRKLGEGKLPLPRNEVILAAAGLITGAAALDLILGVVIISVPGFDITNLAVLGDGTGIVAGVICFLGILGLGALLWVNARPAKQDPSPRPQ